MENHILLILLNTYLNRMKVIFEEAMKQGMQTYKRINPFTDGIIF